MRDILYVFCLYLFLFFMFVQACLVGLFVERDIMGAVVISPPLLPPRCREYETFIDCRTVGVKKDYFQTMQRNGWMEMNTWYMETKK